MAGAKRRILEGRAREKGEMQHLGARTLVKNRKGGGTKGRKRTEREKRGT